MNPRNELLTAARRPSETTPNETKQRIKDATTIRAHNHGAAQRNFAGIWSHCVEESCLPVSRHIDTELPFGRCIGFVATDFPCLLVHWSVIDMTINRRGACVEPKARQMCELTNGPTSQARRVGSGVHDCLTICRCISAIYASARQIDEQIGLFEFGFPVAQMLSIPIDNAPRRRK